MRPTMTTMAATIDAIVIDDRRCAGCAKTVTSDDQLRLSMFRLGKPLCRPCYPGHY